MTHPTIFNPYLIMDAMSRTTIDDIENDPVYQQAIALAEQVQALHHIALESPRWAGLFDQVSRSSSSIALNIAQGWGKLRGFTQSDWLCSRAEAAETYAALTILPKPFQVLKPALKKLYRDLDAAILNLPNKPQA